MLAKLYMKGKTKLDNLDETKQDSGQYSTRDYYIASFLKARGFKLISTNKKGREVYFLFDNREKVEKILPGFYNGTESVIAIDLVAAIRNIKSMLHNI